MIGVAVVDAEWRMETSQGTSHRDIYRLRKGNKSEVDMVGFAQTEHRTTRVSRQTVLPIGRADSLPR